MFREKLIENGKIYYSDLLPQLEHFFTTRDTNVDENRTVICNYLRIEPENLINPTQTHSSNVDFAKVGVTDYPDTDALILDNSEQALYLRFADCTPVILYNKKTNIAAIAHAGWRGTAEKIVVKTVQKMIDNNSDTDDIYAVIGPAIGICCYEVGNEVIEKMKNTISDYEGVITDDNHIDLKGINARQLKEAGVLEKNIDICPFCTSCRNDIFYSYRKENGTPYRHNAVIKLGVNL